MVAKEALQVTKWPSAKICQVIASIPGFTIRPFFAKKALRKPEPLFTVYEFPHAPNHLHCTVYSIQYTQFIRIILAWYQVNEPFHFGTCFITESGYVTWPKLSGSLGFAQRNTSHQPFELKSEYVTHNYPFQIYALPPTRCYIATWQKYHLWSSTCFTWSKKSTFFPGKGDSNLGNPCISMPLNHTEACDSELTADHTGVRITVGDVGWFFSCSPRTLRSPTLGKWQEIWNDYNSIMFFWKVYYLIQRVTLWKWWVLSLNPGVLFWNCRENIGFCWLFGTRTEPIFTPPILDPFELRNFVLVWQSSYKTWTLPGFQAHPTFLAYPMIIDDI